MCGIIGTLRRDRPVERAMFVRAMRTLHHRGPDAEGWWRSADRLTALGHTRLSLVAPGNGAQPLVSEDGRCCAVVNGEFYGHEALRRQLESRGHRFATDSDSEVVLHLYEEHGERCVEHLRGEFAFAIYDERRRRLFAARDRFGVKPFCYCEHDGGVSFASEAKALFALGVQPAWDGDAVRQALSLQYTPPDRTLFAGVRQLPPGNWLIADDAGVRVRRYWDLDYPVDDAGALSEATEHASSNGIEEASREVRAHLEEAVRLRLRGDAPVCVHLSGGLDSSSVAALAARHHNGRLPCFTVSFDHGPYDEWAVARELADHIGAELHTVKLSQRALVEALPDAVGQSEGLAVNGHLPAKYLLNRAIREAGFKVALSGEGADEVFAGYAHLREDFNQLSPVGTPTAAARIDAERRVSAGVMLCDGDEPALSIIAEALGYAPTFLKAKRQMGERMRDVMSHSFGASIERFDSERGFLAAFGDSDQLAGRHPVHQSLYLWSKSALAQYILRTLGDGTEMAHGVEGRPPFLDHALFEHARRLPLAIKIDAGVEKRVLREAVRDVVTPTVYQRPKQPFVAPPLSLFSEAGALDVVRDTLASRAFADQPFFDRRAVTALLDGLPRLSERQRCLLDPVLMTVLSATHLQAAFNPTEVTA